MNEENDRPVISQEFQRRAQEYAQKIGAYADSYHTYGVCFVRFGSKVLELVSWYDLSRELGFSPEESSLSPLTESDSGGIL